VLDQVKRLFSALKASVRAYTWYWAGGAAVVVAGVAALLIFGNLFGPSGRTVCQIARYQTVVFGVLPGDATLEGSGKAAKVAGRRECTLTSGGETYIATTEMTCRNVDIELAEIKSFETKKPLPKEFAQVDKRCFSLYAVERSDGLTIYQKRAVPDDETPAPQPVEQNQSDQSSDQQAGAAAGQNPPANDTSDVEVARPAAGGGPQQ